MYGVVDNLQGKKPVFLKPQKRGTKKVLKRCLWRCGQAILSFLRHIRATILVLLLTLGLPGFYLTLHFLLRPSLRALAADYQPASCSVYASTVLRGKNTCKWSSCRQGCTVQELYICWQVLIARVNATHDGYATEEAAEASSTESGEAFPGLRVDDGEALNESSHVASDVRSSTEDASVLDTADPPQLARLMINPEGCGYGSCDAWWSEYGRVDAAFACYVSADGRLAVPDLDRNYVLLQALLGALPLLLMAASFLLMYRLYWRRGSTDRTLRLSPDLSVRKAKWDDVRAEMFVQRAMDQKNRKAQKFDAALVMKVSNLRKNEVAAAAAESQQAWASQEEEEEEDLDATQKKEKKKKLDLARRWRKIAAMAKLHPAISRRRRFPEVALEL